MILKLSARLRFVRSGFLQAAVAMRCQVPEPVPQLLYALNTEPVLEAPIFEVLNGRQFPNKE